MKSNKINKNNENRIELHRNPHFYFVSPTLEMSSDGIYWQIQIFWWVSDVNNDDSEWFKKNRCGIKEMEVWKSQVVTCRYRQVTIGRGRDVTPPADVTSPRRRLQRRPALMTGARPPLRWRVAVCACARRRVGTAAQTRSAPQHHDDHRGLCAFTTRQVERRR